MSDALTRKQPLIGDVPAAALSLQWHHRGDAGALWRALQALAEPGVVVGLGEPLLAAVGARVPGARPFTRLHRGRYTFPATQADVWVLAPAPAAGAAFQAADRVRAALAPVALLVEATPMFRYRDGHDLTGYVDGTENPEGDAAWAAALVAEGTQAGSSFVLVQRWLHFRDRFAALPQTARDLTIGRREADDEEIAEAPETAHVKRTAQEDYEPPAFMLRRSMPWGDPRRHGLQFIAYMDDLDKAARMLERMIGLDDGRQDALLAHSQAETGGYFWCPPWDGRRLVLPVAAPPASAAAAPAIPAPLRVRLLTDGPLAVEGPARVAGLPVDSPRLCRCGASRNKPHCDGSHASSGFRAAGEEPPLDEPQATPGRGTLQVQPVADGPLALYGAVEIVAESGRRITCAENPTLCRCGRSAARPFCDGSHAAAAFHADE